MSVLLVAVAASATASSDKASGDAQLAERFAPVFRLQDQPKSCGRGEPYEPASVDIVLGNPAVVLRGPGGERISAPTAAQVAGKGPGWYLDLPGNPLRPGCSYERLFELWNAGRPAVVYAHVATEAGDPDHLALQYWIFYLFNDWNDVHEGDWEMVQLDFRADSAIQALSGAPYQIVYAQHAGGQTSAWTGGALQREGSHPIIYPAAGSHASYFSRGLWLGRSASEGFGCDDSRGPSRTVTPEVEMLPAAPAADSPDAWLDFAGRWGQKERSFNNGPTGPAQKQAWSKPFTWEEGVRDSSIAVPGGTKVGPSTTGVFCSTTRASSALYTAVVAQPWLGGIIGGALILLLAGAAAGTQWSPKRTSPLRARRRLGQVLRVTAALYAQHPILLVGLGLPFIVLPLLFLVDSQVLPWLVLTVGGGKGSPIGHTDVGRAIGEVIGGLAGTAALVVSFTAVAIVAVGATALALDELDQGKRPSFGRAIRITLRRKRAVIEAAVRIGLPILILTIVVVGIPFAARRIVRAMFVPMAITLEGRGAVDALRRSRYLVAGREWRLTVTMAVLYGITTLASVTGGLALLLFVVAIPVVVANVIGSALFLIGLAGAAVAVSLVYFDIAAADGEIPSRTRSPADAAPGT